MIAHFRRLNAWLRILLVLIAVGTTPLFAQISFNDFSNVSSLALNGTNGNTAQQVVNGNGQYVLQLTPDNTSSISGTAWFQTQQQSVSGGFTTVFQFQITHNPGNYDFLGPADGIAFVIQNSSGAGQGTAAAGSSGSGIGYGYADPGQFGTPIPNSLAIEFDTYQDYPYDPNGNHVAVQSCGTDSNTQDHTAICPDGNPANLGIVADLGGITLADGNVHTAVLQYDPGTLSIFVDNLGTPLLVVNVDLSTQLSLNNGSAWVGFTGSEGGYYEANDILSWTFAPANAPTQITQTLTPSAPNVQTNYVYGSYNHKLQYSGANSGDNVTVTGTPINQQTFHDTRLAGTPFANAQCAIYDGTGGLCVYFEVTCNQSQGNDCTNLNYDLFNNFNTSQTITGACVLKAPIGTNNWQNIIETFTQGRNDPGTHGGSKGFSDFVVGQNCTALPSVTITSPANGSTVIEGQSVPITFSCAPDPNAPFVTITSCTGLLNGNPVNSGSMVTFNTLGPGTLVVTATDSVLDTNTQTSNFTVGLAPAFTSANNATFQVGTPGSFQVTTTGSPAASITETPALPAGLSLVSHGDGTATLGGTPAANTGGVYNITLMASNSAGNAMQAFTVTVLQTPAITSANNATFQVGVFGSFTVTTTGFPTPSIGESGGLPGNVGFHDNGNGTGTLSGTPTNGGTFNISFTATNTAGSSGQNFTLTVSGGAQVSFSPTSINFGNVRQGSWVWQNLLVKNVGTATLQISNIYITDGTADKDDYSFFSLCGRSLPAGKTCLITVYFNADDLGLRTATLNFADNAPNSPQGVPLSGTVVKH
ncbi:MAG: choice-of-anchor D domain-containing protein [Terriglobales bacterium]